MGRPATYKVTLTKEERNELKAIASKGSHTARKVLFARALLLLDVGEFAEERWNVSDVSTAVGFSVRTLDRMKQRFVEDGLDAALERKERETPLLFVRFDV